MVTQDITIRLPEPLYVRLQQAAQATQRPLEELVVRAVQVGSPPSWEEAPAEFQADLAMLDRLEDDALWRIARSTQRHDDMTRYQELLDKNANGVLTAPERTELTQLAKPLTASCCAKRMRLICCAGAVMLFPQPIN